MSMSEQTASADTEAWLASDVRLTDTAFRYEGRSGAWKAGTTFSFSTIGIDYQPVDVDLSGFSRSVLHRRFSGQGNLRYSPSSDWTFFAGAGGYSGFTGFRSAWINEWYQQFFAGVPGLRSASPRGANLSAGARWEYRPTLGFAEIQYTYARDVIAPAYDEILDDIEGLIGVRRLRHQLNTQALQFSSENVWHRRLRTRAEFRFSSQSEREVRLAGVGSLNWAFAECGVLRLDGGYVREALADDDTGNSPGTFSGWWTGATTEWRPAENWRISLGGRHYRDTGEIENSIGFSSAAPAVNTWLGVLGIRWNRNGHHFKLSGGPYFSDYSEVSFSNIFFGKLYRDRTAAIIQVAYEHTFQ